jgi:methionine-rich copper-binding protein CopC
MALNIRRAATLLGCILLALALAPRFASAHALLLHSTPAEHAVIHDRAVPIKLDFNSRIDGPRSRLTLTTHQDAAAAHPIALKPVLQPAPQTLTTAPAAPLAPGAYDLRWIVLAADGHISRGEIPFTVE